MFVGNIRMTSTDISVSFEILKSGLPITDILTAQQQFLYPRRHLSLKDMYVSSPILYIKRI